MKHDNIDVMQLIVKHLSGSDDLTAAQAVRAEVFQQEQGISSVDDLDGRDLQAEHFIALDGDKVIGTARVRVIDGVATIERVAILKAYRGQAVGRQIMIFLLVWLRKAGIESALLDSETYAAPFYLKLGFKVEGSEFTKVGLPHVKMAMSLRKQI